MATLGLDRFSWGAIIVALIVWAFIIIGNVTNPNEKLNNLGTASALPLFMIYVVFIVHWLQQGDRFSWGAAGTAVVLTGFLLFGVLFQREFNFVEVAWALLAGAALALVLFGIYALQQRKTA